MPLEFIEIEKAAAPVEFFNRDTKARPQHLEGEVIPELIRRVGDVKSNRVALWMVEKYLEKNVLIFDPKLLQEMFKEADYKSEESLDPRALAAAISGRYPKRKLTKEWRQLVTLLLGQPELILSEDIVDQKVAKNGVFNAESVWTRDPPTLPPINRRRVKSADAKKPFQKPVPGTSSTGGTTAGLARGISTNGSSLGRTTPFAGMAQGDVSSGDTVLTTSGLKTTAPAPAEEAINQAFGSGAGEVPRSTFAGVERFDDFTQGQQVQAQMGLGTVMASAMAASAAASQQMPAGASCPWSLPPRAGALRAWNAALPPTAITLHTSSLSTLRSTVWSTAVSKPEFSRLHKSLTPSQLDLKKTLGAGMDMTATINRVEPTRPTCMRKEADFVQWGDYARNCPTAPSAWYNEHASLPAAACVPTKYPWGEWGLAD